MSDVLIQTRMSRRQSQKQWGKRFGQRRGVGEREAESQWVYCVSTLVDLSGVFTFRPSIPAVSLSTPGSP